MKRPAATRPGFDPDLADRPAECDGGGLLPGGRYAARQEFAGTLTGEYYDEGDPPWRWYRMHALTHKPADFPFDAVWCESESLYLLGPDPGAHLPARRAGARACVKVDDGAPAAGAGQPETARDRRRKRS